MNFDDLRVAFEDVAFTTATPFTPGGDAVDHEALAENLQYMDDAGATLFIPCGNTGEYYALSHDERKAVVETHVEAVGGEGNTIAGGVAGNVETATDLARAYEAAGADAIMVMHPDFTYLHEQGLIEYYEAVADATDLGVVLYKRGPEVSKRVVSALTGRDDVVAVKFAVNDVKEFSQTVSDAPGPVTWVNGIAERYALSYHAEGATGYTTGIGNFVPEATLALHDALTAGDLERARELRDLLRPLEDLREETGEGNDLPTANNVPVVKHGLDQVGLTGRSPRPPLVDLSAEDASRASEYTATVREYDL